MPAAARSQPSPTAPTPSRSSAMAGSRATAPPNSTANRSSEMAPSRIGVRRMKRRPSSASCSDGRSCGSPSGGAPTTHPRSQAHEPDGHDAGHHERRGGHERPDRRADVEEARHHRPDDEGHLPRHRREGHEPREHRRRHHVDRQGPGRRSHEGTADAEHHDDDEDRDHRRGIGRGVPGQAEGAHELDAETDGHDPPAVEPVGHRTRHQHEEEGGQELGEAEEAEVERLGRSCRRRACPRPWPARPMRSWRRTSWPAPPSRRGRAARLEATARCPRPPEPTGRGSQHEDWQRAARMGRRVQRA